MRKILSNIIVGFSALAMLSGVALAKSPSSPILGNLNAPQGGTAYYNLPEEPNTLNPITFSDYYATQVLGWVVDSLLNRNPQTYAWMPALATKWSVSKNGKVFTFVLRKGATFFDGRPVTIQDVKFSFDVIFNKTYNAANLVPYYEDISKAVITGPQTIKFYAKSRYWGNFDSLATMSILPEHVYGDAKKGIKLNHTVMASGPYMVERYDLGNRIILKRNPNWWGNKVPMYKGYYKINRIIYRFISDPTIQLQSIKNHDLTMLDQITPEQFAQKAVGPGWGTAVIKEKVQNLAPKPYRFIGWNLRPPTSPANYVRYAFEDRRVRVALAHLMNRQLMIQKFRFNMSLPATGPWYRQSPYADPTVKPIDYNPRLAQKLLQEAGWTDMDHDGVLAKIIKGKKVKFRFTLIYAKPDLEKYFTMYQQSLRNAGIDMTLRLVQWNAFTKLVEDHQFDALSMGWAGGSVDEDPKQIWSSSSAGKNGSNFIDYRNPTVDKLIDEARVQMSRKRRIQILRKVYRIIANDAPYLFMFNDKYTLYMHLPQLKMVKPTFPYDIGSEFWWMTK